jgi:Domain of unknown function (DUF1906)
MANYAGFDTDIYPGPTQLAWLKANTNLRWCGYYLAPAPSHPNTSWMGQRQTLRAQGWGLAPIFVGQQTTERGSHNAVGPQGSTDGALAAELASDEGFPPQSCIFLDWEDGSRPSEQVQAYISAWANAVAEIGYEPGIYCSHELAPGMAGLIGHLNPAPALRIWAWKVTAVAAHPYEGSIESFPDSDPSGCGYAPAVAWQCQQNCELSLPGAPIASMQVDLSCSDAADPSAPQ